MLCLEIQLFHRAVIHGWRYMYSKSSHNQRSFCIQFIFDCFSSYHDSTNSIPPLFITYTVHCFRPHTNIHDPFKSLARSDKELPLETSLVESLLMANLLLHYQVTVDTLTTFQFAQSINFGLGKKILMPGDYSVTYFIAVSCAM